MTTRRSAFTLVQLLVLMAMLALLMGMLLPALMRIRGENDRARVQNNLKQLALACHNYHDSLGTLPAGNTKQNFSASAYLLPYIEQANLQQKLDFKKPVTDEANAEWGKTIVKVFVSPRDPLPIKDGGTNFLFNAGSKPALAKNDGVFFQDSAVTFADIKDGTSNTVMLGETLRGDRGAEKKATVARRHVRLKADALKGIKDEAGVQDFKDGKHLASDRCAGWIDGRFLQGTYTATRTPNSDKPDVDCGGLGGLSALRSLNETIGLAWCDGSVRPVKTTKMEKKTWTAIHTRDGGEAVGDF